jgi:CRP/FNR family cyclic AMP-dependent transcriptional regulator
VREEREIVALLGERFEQRCQLVVTPGCFWPKCAGIHSKLVSDANHPHRLGLSGSSSGGVRKRLQGGQSDRDSRCLQEVASGGVHFFHLAGFSEVRIGGSPSLTLLNRTRKRQLLPAAIARRPLTAIACSALVRWLSGLRRSIDVQLGFPASELGFPASHRRESMMSEIATSQTEILEALRSLAFLRGMPDDHLRSLTRLAKQVEFPAGTVIFNECEPATHCYVIVEGSVLMEICGTEKCTTILTVGPGELLGWSTILGASRLTVTARCLEPTRAIELLGADVTAECEADPILGYQLMKCVARTLSGRLTATRLQLLDLFRG